MVLTFVRSAASNIIELAEGVSLIILIFLSFIIISLSFIIIHVFLQHFTAAYNFIYFLVTNIPVILLLYKLI